MHERPISVSGPANTAMKINPSNNTKPVMASGLWRNRRLGFDCHHSPKRVVGFGRVLFIANPWIDDAVQNINNHIGKHYENSGKNGKPEHRGVIEAYRCFGSPLT